MQYVWSSFDRMPSSSNQKDANGTGSFTGRARISIARDIYISRYACVLLFALITQSYAMYMYVTHRSNMTIYSHIVGELAIFSFMTNVNQETACVQSALSRWTT